MGIPQVLTRFSTESGVFLGGATDLAEGNRSPGLQGRYSLEQALGTLLAGSGLSYRFTGEGRVTLKRSPVSQGPIQLSAITVQGEKIGRNVFETSAGTTVVNRQAVETPRNDTVNDAVQGLPNVNAEDISLLPAIRGIHGSAGFNGGATIVTGAQPRVPYLVDGVPVPLTLGPNLTTNSVWDVDSIEVARGPQSTMTGRNAVAGAIRVNTADPVFYEEYAVRAKAYNRDGTFSGAGMLNVPVVEDELALRVTAEAEQGEGFVDFTGPANLADDVEETEFYRFRGKLLWEPRQLGALSMMLTLDQHETESTDFQGHVDDASSLTRSFLGSAGLFQNRSTTVTLNADYSFGNKLELETRVSLLDTDTQIPGQFSDFFDVDFDNETLIAEAFLRFRDLGFVDKAVLGVAYEWFEEIGSSSATSGFPFNIDGSIENISIFSEAEIEVAPRWTLIAGGRVEFDERDRKISIFGNNPSIDLSDTGYSPRLGLRHALSDRTVIAYTYSEGYRPGGMAFDLFNPGLGVGELESEQLKQHEISTRSRFMDGRASLNAAVFYYEFEDQQALVNFGPPVNIPETRGYGLEVDGTLQVTRDIELFGALGLLETEITDGGTVAPGLEGEELSRSPNVTASGGMRYATGSGLDAAASFRYVGDQAAGLGNVSGSSDIDAYTVVDLSLGYDFALSGDTDARVEGFVADAFDERYVIDDFGGTEVVGRPRTFGVAVTVRF